MSRFVGASIVVAGCGEPPPSAPLAPPPVAARPVAAIASAAPPPAPPGNTNEQAITRLAEAPAKSLAGLWLRRLAVAYRGAKDAKAPEVEIAAEELAFAIEWAPIEERKTLLEGVVTLAPVFEHARAPIPSRLPPSPERPSDYRAAKAASEAAIRPAVVALYTKLAADGRRTMLFGMDDVATLTELFAVTTRDGVCPSIRDDRDLGWRAWRTPGAAACVPPTLPDDELHDLERLSAELPGPWPRAVRAIAALRDMRDRERPRFTPTLAQQKRFVEGCTKHPMCPLWLLDKPDPALRPTLEAALKTATEAQRGYLERAIAESQGKDGRPSRTAADAANEVTRCVDLVVEDLASSAESWIREARATKHRRACLADIGLVPKDTLVALVPKADPETASFLVEAAFANDKRAKIPESELVRLAADVRTRIVVYRALVGVKREREMPADMRKHDALLESEAVSAVRRRYGRVPDKLEREAPSKMVVEKRPVTFELFRVSAGGEHAEIPPITVAVGPFRPGQAYAPFHESGTDWGTEAGGLRKLVEEHFADPRSVDFFDSYR